MPLWGLGRGVLSKNAESLRDSDALMRVAVPQASQPSGAATPRDSDAHKRIAVPKAFCVLREHPGQDLKAAKFAVLTPGPGMFVNVRNAPRVVIPPPIRNAPRFAV